MSNKTALITGINSQDGIYLSKLLLAKNYRVIGVIRNKNSQAINFEIINKNVELLTWDKFIENKIEITLEKYKVNEIYNLAAISSGIGVFINPFEIGSINGLLVVRILEAILNVDSSIRFFQASSREIFGDAEESPQSETSLKIPRNPYGAAKLYADNIVKIFRDKYNIFACSGILYNHESPYRRKEFVSKKITYAAAQIKLRQATKLYLGNLDAKCDWGFAGDYVEAMWLMLQQNSADDYIIATGKLHSVREFCSSAFGILELNYKDYVVIDTDMVRPIDKIPLTGNIEKAKEKLKWEPKVKFNEFINLMVKYDINNISNK